VTQLGGMVSRQAHNLRKAGSIPAAATILLAVLVACGGGRPAPRPPAAPSPAPSAGPPLVATAPDPFVDELAFFDRGVIWRPQLQHAFSVEAGPEFDEQLVDHVLAQATAATGGDVGFARGLRSVPDVRLVLDGADPALYRDGQLVAAAVAYQEQRGGVMVGGRVVVAHPVWITPKVLLHELGHVLGLGHTQAPGPYVMGGAPLEQDAFDARERAAWRWIAAQAPGTRRAGADVRPAAAPGPVVCRELLP